MLELVTQAVVIAMSRGKEGRKRTHGLVKKIHKAHGKNLKGARVPG